MSAREAFDIWWKDQPWTSLKRKEAALEAWLQAWISRPITTRQSAPRVGSVPTVEELKEAHQNGWNDAIENFHDEEAEEWAWSSVHALLTERQGGRRREVFLASSAQSSEPAANVVQYLDIDRQGGKA